MLGPESNEQSAATQTIVIVGGGFSGTMVAVHLLRESSHRLQLHLFEKQPERLARGVAYSTTYNCHLLNVPATGMSAYPDRPEHFVSWVNAISPEQGTTSQNSPQRQRFLPRRMYGDYLKSVLAETVSECGSQHDIRFHDEEVVDVRIKGSAVQVIGSRGTVVTSDQTVLALGNFPPGDPLRDHQTLRKSPRYARNPWEADVLPRLLASKSCLLIGSGLSMLDIALVLKTNGYVGTVHVVSRRGLLPAVHQPAGSVPDITEVLNASGMRQTVAAVRRCVADNDGDWRAVIDAMRPTSSHRWKSLSAREKRQFLRHVRPYWEIHRHRTASQIRDVFDGMIASGQVLMRKGRIDAAEDLGTGVLVSLQDNGRRSRIFVDCVVNCTGPECNFRNIGTPLVDSLLHQGLATTDVIGFGLAATSDGALIDSTGAQSSQLFTIGPPMKGQLWETTAVPELRAQARQLARRLLGESEAPNAEGSQISASRS